MLCPGVPCRPSIFFFFPFNSSHVTHHLWLYLPWAWFDQRGKAGEREDLWITYDALPPRNWGITIRILVPLLCYSVPVVKVGYATEQAETKQVFWTGGLRFPQRRRRCLGHRTKKDNKKSKKKKKHLKCRGTGKHLRTQGIEGDNYLQQEIVTGGETENTSIYPFSVCLGPSGSRFSKETPKSFSTSSSSSLGIPRDSKARQDM